MMYIQYVHTGGIDMAEYTTKPAQFRLPPWAHEFLAQEASATGASKTEVVLDALEDYKRADENLAQAKLWEGALMDGTEPEEW
jgi:hypothetical protein